MGTKKLSLHQMDTYVYIDVSNIRMACTKTLGARLDFVRLMKYLRRKYPQLKEVRYYEGISTDDERRRRTFEFLERWGFIICALERKAYNSVDTEDQEVECPECGHRWTTELRHEHIVRKSNVDVYLATELLTVAHKATKPTHIILVSCDGDYAEMIHNATENPNVVVSVLATPSTRDPGRNALSRRLRQLCSDYQDAPGIFHLRNIENIDCFWLDQ